MNEIGLRKDVYESIGISLPFYLHSVGCHSYAAGEGEYPSLLVNTFVQLIWCVSGIGEVTLYDRKYTLQAGDFFYYLPGEDHSYRAISPLWKHRWVCFDGPKAADFMMSYGYPRHIRNAGTCPEQLFERLTETVSLGDPFQMRMHISILAEILALAGVSKKRDLEAEPLVRQCVHLIQTSFQDPRVDINYLCEKLGVHRATLTRNFHQAMHRTPGEYLLAVRAHHGMTLLCGTNQSVSEIARRCGVGGIVRFSRLIRRITGCSPTQYRAEHRREPVSGEELSGGGLLQEKEDL